MSQGFAIEKESTPSHVNHIAGTGLDRANRSQTSTDGLKVGVPLKRVARHSDQGLVFGHENVEVGLGRGSHATFEKSMYYSSEAEPR